MGHTSWKGPTNGDIHMGSVSEQDPQRGIVRPLTLLESLPYSPQTATLPFLPDIIPGPTIGSGSAECRLDESFPTGDFDNFNAEARTQSQLPKNARHAVDTVLQDLKPAQRTPYTFKSVVTRNTRLAETPKSLALGLTPITSAVYDRVGHYFKSTKAGVSSPLPINGKPQRHKLKRESLSNSGKSKGLPHLTETDEKERQTSSHTIQVAIPKKDFDDSAYIDSRHSDNSDLSASAQLQQEQAQFAPQDHVDVETGSHPIASSNQETEGNDARFRIEISSAGINRDDYVEVRSAPNAPQGLSAPRQPLEQQSRVGASLDQRQRGEAAADTLERLMRSIFAAAGHTLALQSGYEHVVTMNDQDVTMTAVSQQKMHSALQKVIDLSFYERVPVENLLRIIKLSEGSFKQVEELEMRLNETWDESAFDAWIVRLSDLDTALKAARTCLRILAGGREEKQLYSESVIQGSINLFRIVAEDLVMPVAELRNSGPTAPLFKMLNKHKKVVGGVLSAFQKLYSLLASLVTKIQLSETVINTLEYTSSRLIFVENAYYEKDSALGVQKFDAIRSVAMDMLCQIFLLKPEQRQGIIDDIVTSLEKLPIGKQTARQFKLTDGPSIQPVSALIMRLIQAGSTRIDNSTGPRTNLVDDAAASDNELDPQKEQQRAHFTPSLKSEAQSAQQHAVAINDLAGSVAPLSAVADQNALYVIDFIVTRAMGASKSGDTPYRHLLDLFVDDFVTCLDSPEWPSAELLLRVTMIKMVKLFRDPKAAAPTKNMALEVLGSLTSTISRLRSQVKRNASSLETGGSDELTHYLSELGSNMIEQPGSVELVVEWNGPSRVALEYLQGLASDQPYLTSAISFLMTDWAARICTGYSATQGDDVDWQQELGRLSYRLRMMIQDQHWLVNEYTFKKVSQSQAKFAYSLLLLQSSFCGYFSDALNILLGSMQSDQATVRSKSLKSINQVLETDSSILDGESPVLQCIIDRSSDSSTQVRDSALGLLSTCISLRPALEPSVTAQVLDRFTDMGVGVRKRAMKMARDVYLRNRDKMLRSAIANGLLRRVQDPEEGVRDIARQLIEEVWFAPFYHSDGSAASQTLLAEHVSLIIQTVKTGTVTEILDKVFQTVLKPQNREKALEGPFSVCLQIVNSLFGMIDIPETEDPTVASGRDALQVLTIFAKAEPKLFNLEQIRLLQPQLASYSGQEELAAFRAVTVIYKRVLPGLPTVSTDLLQGIRAPLQKAVGKIQSRGAMDDLIACFKVCCELLGDFNPLANLAASGITGISKLPRKGIGEGKPLNLLTMYAVIVGCVAKHCDLDLQLPVFKTRFPSWQGDSVTRLIVDTLSPYTTPDQVLDVRKAALEAMGLVCQSWPRNYVLAKVYTAFQQAFQDRTSALEAMILRSFKEFLMTEEKRSEQKPDGGTTKQKKELTVMGGTNFDDVASATTQRFLKDITRIATSTQDEHAFLAMEVLGSINRQGLTHPKETGVTLMTLETSANRKIAELAFSEHRSLHEKHETVLEREYVKAVQAAFNYQRDVVGDTHGATTEPYESKLHLLVDVLKISKMKNRQRFFEKLLLQIDFDLEKLEDCSDGPPQHYFFARFIIENLAFLEYQTIGEVQAVVHAAEKMVTSTGASVAQAIESEIFQVTMDADAPASEQGTAFVTEQATFAVDDLTPHDGQGGDMPLMAGAVAPTSAASAAPLVEPSRQRQLSAGAVILLGLWEVRTHLRKLYGMGTSRRDPKAKALAKDLNKTPTKVQGVHSDKIWEELQGQWSGMGSTETQLQKCKVFVELMNVDKEVNVADADVDEDEMGVDGPRTPDGGDDEDEGQDRGRKRKAAGGHTPGGRKKRARSNSQPRKRGRPRKNPLPPTPSAEEDAEGEFDEDWA